MRSHRESTAQSDARAYIQRARKSKLSDKTPLIYHTWLSLGKKISCMVKHFTSTKNDSFIEYILIVNKFPVPDTNMQHWDCRKGLRVPWNPRHENCLRFIRSDLCLIELLFWQFEFDRHTPNVSGTIRNSMKRTGNSISCFFFLHFFIEFSYWMTR